MSGIEWVVVIGGVAAISWVNWYFFLAPPAAKPRASEERRGHAHDHGTHG